MAPYYICTYFSRTGLVNGEIPPQVYVLHVTCRSVTSDRFIFTKLKRPDWVVTTAIGYGPKGPVVESRLRQEIFCSPKPSRPALGPIQYPLQQAPGLSPGGKAGRAWGYSHTSTAEVNEWSYTFTPPIRVHGVCFLALQPIVVVLSQSGSGL